MKIQDTTIAEEEYWDVIIRLSKQDLVYDKILNLWTDLRLYVEDEHLHWLDTPGAFVNFLAMTERTFHT